MSRTSLLMRYKDNPKSSGPKFYAGEVYRGYKDEADGSIHLVNAEGSWQQVRNPHHFDIISIAEEKTMKKAPKKHESYEFIVRSTLQVDDQLVYEGLTSAQPVAIIHAGDTIQVLVHTSLHMKASICKKEVREEFADAFKAVVSDSWNSEFVPRVSEDINRFTAACKAVRNAMPRKKYQGQVKVRVDLLNI